MDRTKGYRIIRPESENIHRRTQNVTANTTYAVILMLVTAAALGMSAALQKDTLIDWWMPAAECGVIALAAGYPLRKCLSADRMKWLRYPAAVIISFSLLLCTFYSLNYYMSDSSTRYEYTGKISNKYSQERYRTRRTPGGRSVRGEKYMAYYIVIEMPEGRHKRMEINAGKYIKARIGRKVRMSVETGLFGIPVIRNTEPGL